MKSKLLVIVGRIGVDDAGRKRGEMTRTIIGECEKGGIPYCRIDGSASWDDITEGDAIVVYLGSKAKLAATIEQCQKRRLTLIIASSGIAESNLPKDLMIPIILAPNLALLIMALFDVLPRFGALAQLLHCEADVAECHQATKTSPPGTAQKIAGFFGNPPESVGSVRDNAAARAMLRIPKADLEAFGDHYIVVSGHGVEISINFRTLGRSAYFAGLMFLIDEVETFQNGLDPGIYHADTLLFGQAG
jgi:dihydrodipicolinate reductase